MNLDVHNRYTNNVQFTADIDCAENTSDSVKLGLAVLWAVESQANLSDADLSGADLSGAYLSRAYLSRAYLSGADLSGANLSGAYLSRAYLPGADLSGANLSCANLSCANLSDANLSDANLSRANLYGANLSDANLSFAYLSRANLSGSVGVVSFGPIGKTRHIGYAVKHDAGPMIQLGCFWGTLDEASAKIRAKYGENSAYENLVRAACAALD